MNLARVIGNLWTTKKEEGFVGVTLLLLQPLTGELKPIGRPLVAADTGGAGVGETVFYVTAREAVLALKGDLDHLTPCDAAIVGIADYVNGVER
ncbi:MAG: EutN/CcmL family microcompartment protein [Planctomycetes bacterium]|nr:EutN/CcmL family microcompartment protein [Planctomycetota bacterium]